MIANTVTKDINVLVLKGRLTKDAEIIAMKKGGFIIKATIATNINNVTSFIAVAKFINDENEANFVANCMTKGIEVKSECIVINNEYVKNDVKIYGYNFVAGLLEVY